MNRRYYSNKSRWAKTSIISGVIAIITALLSIWLESWQFGATASVFVTIAFITMLCAA